jgi:hypothetical protein
MSYGGAFCPKGPTLALDVTTGASAVQSIDVSNEGASYVAWRFAWQGSGLCQINYAKGGANAPVITTPVSGSRYAGFTMNPGQVEVFQLPSSLQLIALASIAGRLEVTPGEGF